MKIYQASKELINVMFVNMSMLRKKRVDNLDCGFILNILCQSKSQKSEFHYDCKLFVTRITLKVSSADVICCLFIIFNLCPNKLCPNNLLLFGWSS